ncbi:MAG: translation initiation factor IF-2 [Candidatus Dasytiphilus stammeri]
MKDINLQYLAIEMKMPVETLKKIFASLGICKSERDTITHKEKEILLSQLELNKKNSLKELSLTWQRKIHSTLNIPGIGGKSKKVKVEIRKKQTYLKEKSVQEIYSHQKSSFSQLSKNSDPTNLDTLLLDSKDLNVSSLKNKNHSPDKIIKKAENAEFKRQAEAVIHQKIEEEARKVAEKARIMAAEINKNLKIEEDLIVDEDLKQEDSIVTELKYTQHSENDNKKIKIDRRIIMRPVKSKFSRQRKNNKHSESKSDREEARVVARSTKNNKRKLKFLQPKFNKSMPNITKNVIIGETITVAELANKMAMKGSEIIKIMMNMGAIATINQVIDQETAQLVAEELGHKVILRRENELEEALLSDRDMGLIAEARPPVVTIMGHVDHGKTSLLDYIRSTKVAKSEAGGITQRIGAYHVKIRNKIITFIDTPGHAAFSAMRIRGVQLTDIVVLVVAADDGVMPQTIEAIQNAQAAKVPIIVAINKIDKVEQSNADRIKKQLSQYGINPEEWGGDNQFVCISAKNGRGIDDLLNAILLQSEMLELKAIHKGMATGVVIESFLDRGRGPVATVLIREGTLNKGDIILCGLEYGHVRAMLNEQGSNISQAYPSIPVEIFGLSGIPAVGDILTVVRDEKKAREVALYRQGKYREVKFSKIKKAVFDFDQMFNNITNSNKMSEFNLLLKSDSQGSIEAIVEALKKLSNTKIEIKIISSGVGAISENDATLAAASKAIIIGFNVRADNSARKIIEQENLDIRYYSVIYNLIDDVKKVIFGKLKPEYKSKIIGLAEVRTIFKSPKFGSIAGCMVKNGIVKRNKLIKVLRDNIVIYEGELESLRSFKNDINEVQSGLECGIGIKNYNDIRIGDLIEVFDMMKVQEKSS